jgi:ABC-type antimicrobial peptide transport system permease subunit
VTTTLEEYTSAAYFTQRLAASLLSILGGLSLLLSAVGLYSLMDYAVTRRRREIGVRMALGASHGQILRLVVGRGLRLLAAGVGVGMLLAAAGTRALSALLFGVSPLDLGALVGAAGLLTLVAFAATYVPARAAAQVDPMRVLRAD